MRKYGWLILVLWACIVWPASSTAYAQVTRPDISQTVSPARDITTVARDGHEVIAVVREPPGGGPFPAVVVAHGGFPTMPREQLRDWALTNATNTRLLANGYVTVVPTFRPRMGDQVLRDALLDNLAIVQYVKEMNTVDPNSVALFGCSAGGDLVLATAGETEVAAIVSEEPVTLLITGMRDARFTGQGDAIPLVDVNSMFADPLAHYTPELRASTREKIRAINAPVLIAQGDQWVEPDVNHLDVQNEILLSEMDAANKEWTRIVYAGEGHCFGWGGFTAKALEFFRDMHSFLKAHLPTQPTPIDTSLVDYVEVAPPEPE